MNGNAEQWASWGARDNLGFSLPCHGHLYLSAFPGILHTVKPHLCTWRCDFCDFWGAGRPSFWLALVDSSNSGWPWANKASGCVTAQSSAGAHLTETFVCTSHREDICSPSAKGTESPVGWSLPGGGSAYNLGHPPQQMQDQDCHAQTSIQTREDFQNREVTVCPTVPLPFLASSGAPSRDRDRSYAKSPSQSFLPVF